MNVIGIRDMCGDRHVQCIRYRHRYMIYDTCICTCDIAAYNYLHRLYRYRYIYIGTPCGQAYSTWLDG